MSCGRGVVVGGQSWFQIEDELREVQRLRWGLGEIQMSIDQDRVSSFMLLYVLRGGV